MGPRVISLFSGAGGLDLGAERAGFRVLLANDNSPHAAATYRRNFPSVSFDARDVRELRASGYLKRLSGSIDGVIGGPPCQSWSAAGARHGIRDQRGELFVEYLRMIRWLRPSFFLAENVPGILSGTNRYFLEELFDELRQMGYLMGSPTVANALDHGQAQDRKRVFIVGYRADVFGRPFGQLPPTSDRLTLQDAIGDLHEERPALPAIEGVWPNGEHASVPNHEYSTGRFSWRYMSRQRVRGWNQPSATVPATARQVPLHPSSPALVKVGTDEYEFASSDPSAYRRLSVRECARLQGFPDDFLFMYDRVGQGYKLVGNAVPVGLAEAVCAQIASDWRAVAGTPSEAPGQLLAAAL